jgi:hypothetical protein
VASGRLIPDHKTIADFRKDDAAKSLNKDARGGRSEPGLLSTIPARRRMWDMTGPLHVDAANVLQV